MTLDSHLWELYAKPIT